MNGRRRKKDGGTRSRRHLKYFWSIEFQMAGSSSGRTVGKNSNHDEQMDKSARRSVVRAEGTRRVEGLRETEKERDRQNKQRWKSRRKKTAACSSARSPPEANQFAGRSMNSPSRYRSRFPDPFFPLFSTATLRIPRLKPLIQSPYVIPSLPSNRLQ